MHCKGHVYMFMCTCMVGVKMWLDYCMWPCDCELLDVFLKWAIECVASNWLVWLYLRTCKRKLRVFVWSWNSAMYITGSGMLWANCDNSLMSKSAQCNGIPYHVRWYSPDRPTRGACHKWTSIPFQMTSHLKRNVLLAHSRRGCIWWVLLQSVWDSSMAVVELLGVSRLVLPWHYTWPLYCEDTMFLLKFHFQPEI